jgi:hypothetical protein
MLRCIKMHKTVYPPRARRTPPTVIEEAHRDDAQTFAATMPRLLDSAAPSAYFTGTLALTTSEC